jgi:hemoglobin-like flavoprotein
VGTALLQTLAQGLGDAFTADVQAAWTEVYGVIAAAMTEASHEASPQAMAQAY